ncbi:LTA synthase family protein [Colwellia sp. MEBiC06753]
MFFELATPAFIHEYGLRPNRLFIEYLAYPAEVSQMLINGHSVALISVMLALVALIYFYLKVINQRIFSSQKAQKHSFSVALSTSLLATTVCLLCARGTLGHRPINPAFVYFSTDPLINSLTLNSAYSVAHAIKELGNEKSATKLYGKMPVEQVIKLVRQESGLAESRFSASDAPSLSIRQPSYQGKPKNLVIILEESLGAQFVSSLGGLPLTPALDKLASEGWAFEHLYATGTRSVRGIEAVITGFTPTPARAVVKLDKSQSGFFTLAQLLKNNNYTTQFIYGGESHFDNMKSFFLGNGFSEIVDFDDIEQPKFVGSWGASDEDLFAQANRELNKLHQQNQPYFSFIFTSSNHDPFEIPSGAITPMTYSKQQLASFSEQDLARHQAIQYADYALGKFIVQAKQQAYWQDTVFLIVADHDARVSGSDLVPINNFHIPGIILNAGRENIVDRRVVSQIDLAPTLLSLIGIVNQSPMLGQDLTNPDAAGRAMMQYADNFAYLKGQQVTILQPQKPALNFSYQFDLQKLVPNKGDVKLEKIALAHALWGSLAYENQWYRGN